MELLEEDAWAGYAASLAGEGGEQVASGQETAGGRQVSAGGGGDAESFTAKLRAELGVEDATEEEEEEEEEEGATRKKKKEGGWWPW